MPDRMSEDMPEDMPDRVPEDMPEHFAEDMPGRMPEDMPDRMPEAMPDKMPEGMSVTKRINVMVGITRSKVILFSTFLDTPKYHMGALKLGIPLCASSVSILVVVAIHDDWMIWDTSQETFVWQLYILYPHNVGPPSYKLVYKLQ